MKKIYFLCSLFLLLACENEPNQLIYPEYIIAGQTDGNGIVYTDIQPNDTLSFFYSSTLTEDSIDLDIDGTVDLKIHFYAAASPAFDYFKHTIIPFNENAIATSESDSYFIDTLRLNDTIGPGLKWVNDTSLLFEHSWVITGTSYREGLWNDAGEKFVGVKIVKDDTIQYGWIRMEIKHMSRLIIYDFACTKGY